MCPCMAIYYCSPCVSVSVCPVYSFNQTATWPQFALAPFFKVRFSGLWVAIKPIAKRARMRKPWPSAVAARF